MMRCPRKLCHLQNISLVFLQIEECNEPFLDSLRQYDDRKDLSLYDFKQDDFSTPTDDLNKRKLAYRHRAVAHKYEKVLIHFICYLLLMLYASSTYLISL